MFYNDYKARSSSCQRTQQPYCPLYQYKEGSSYIRSYNTTYTTKIIDNQPVKIVKICNQQAKSDQQVQQMSCQQIQNINRMFGNELTIDASYDVNQLLKFQSEQPPQISIQDMNILNKNFEKLEQYFINLVHKKPQNILQKFLIIVDKKIDDFLINLDQASISKYCYALRSKIKEHLLTREGVFSQNMQKIAKQAEFILKMHCSLQKQITLKSEKIISIIFSEYSFLDKCEDLIDFQTTFSNQTHENAYLVQDRLLEIIKATKQHNSLYLVDLKYEKRKLFRIFTNNYNENSQCLSRSLIERNKLITEEMNQIKRRKQQIKIGNNLFGLEELLSQMSNCLQEILVYKEQEREYFEKKYANILQQILAKQQCEQLDAEKVIEQQFLEIDCLVEIPFGRNENVEKEYVYNEKVQQMKMKIEEDQRRKVEMYKLEQEKEILKVRNTQQEEQEKMQNKRKEEIMRQNLQKEEKMKQKELELEMLKKKKEKEEEDRQIKIKQEKQDEIERIKRQKQEQEEKKQKEEEKIRIQIEQQNVLEKKKIQEQEIRLQEENLKKKQKIEEQKRIQEEQEILKQEQKKQIEEEKRKQQQRQKQEEEQKRMEEQIKQQQLEHEYQLQQEKAKQQQLLKEQEEEKKYEEMVKEQQNQKKQQQLKEKEEENQKRQQQIKQEEEIQKLKQQKLKEEEEEIRKKKIQEECEKETQKEEKQKQEDENQKSQQSCDKGVIFSQINQQQAPQKIKQGSNFNYEDEDLYSQDEPQKQNTPPNVKTEDEQFDFSEIEDLIGEEAYTKKQACQLQKKHSEKIIKQQKPTEDLEYFDDLDFEEEIEEECIEMNQFKKEDQANNYEMDFEDEDQNQENKLQKLKHEQEIIDEQLKLQVALIQKTNEYVRNTRFGRQNKVNFQKFDKFESLITLYEEFIQLNSCFFFDFSEGNLMINMFYNLEKLDEQQQGEQVDDFIKNIQEIYYSTTQQYEIDENVRLFFPFQPNNELSFQLIEVNQQQQTICFYYLDQISSQNTQKIDEFGEFFMYIFSFENFQIFPSTLQENTSQIIQTLDGYCRYILMLFPIVYEEKMQIEVDFQTIERIFYILLSLEYLYIEMENNHDGIVNKFQEITLKHTSNIKNCIFEDINSQNVEKMKLHIEEYVKEMDKKDYLIGQFEFQIENMKYVYYIYLHKIESVVEIGIFCLTVSDQFNEQIIDFLAQMQSEQITIKPYVEISRHNGLYEYNDFTMAVWAHLIEKNKYTPFEAINVINFSMLPYYLIYKNLD